MSTRHLSVVPSPFFVTFLVNKKFPHGSAVPLYHFEPEVSTCIFKVHNVSQWPNLRHLAEPLGGAVGLLEAVSFKEATESVGRGRTTDARG